MHVCNFFQPDIVLPVLNFTVYHPHLPNAHDRRRALHGPRPRFNLSRPHRRDICRDELESNVEHVVYWWRSVSR